MTYLLQHFDATPTEFLAVVLGAFGVALALLLVSRGRWIGGN